MSRVSSSESAFTSIEIRLSFYQDLRTHLSQSRRSIDRSSYPFFRSSSLSIPVLSLFCLKEEKYIYLKQFVVESFYLADFSWSDKNVEEKSDSCLGNSAETLFCRSIYSS